MNQEQFLNIDLGSVKPTSIPMEKIEVGIGLSEMVSDYGKAFVKEAWRKNPLRMEQISLTPEEMTDYCDYLFTKRIESIQDSCADWRKLKNLYIPAYVQYAMSMIGKVTIRNRGIQLIPVDNHPSKMTFDQALAISDKIGMLLDDLQIVKDAMPRSEDGNIDVMSTALIAGYVRSLGEVGHVSATYVTAFMDMKLKQETAFQTLYRVQYDDVDFIQAALITQKGLY